MIAVGIVCIFLSMFIWGIIIAFILKAKKVPINPSQEAEENDQQGINVTNKRKKEVFHIVLYKELMKYNITNLECEADIQRAILIGNQIRAGSVNRNNVIELFELGKKELEERQNEIKKQKEEQKRIKKEQEYLLAKKEEEKKLFREEYVVNI